MKAWFVDHVLVTLVGLLILALPIILPLMAIAAICILVAFPPLTLLLIFLTLLLR